MSDDATTTTRTTIQDFPAALQPIISQGFLDREFDMALRSRMGFRAVADRVEIASPIGEPVVRTRGGLKPAVTEPGDAARWTVEEYTITPNLYSATTDLLMVTSRVGLVSQFLQNAFANGEQAARSLDELARNALYAAYAAPETTIRPHGKTDTVDLMAGDSLTMGLLLDAVTKLRINAAPEIDGAYNCYLDPVSARQLFADPDFRQLFQGATSANQVFRRGMVIDFLGLRFVPTNEMFVRPHPNDMIRGVIRSPIICAAGALVEGSSPDIVADGLAPPPHPIVSVVNGVAMTTDITTDRLAQIIRQSWYWIGGYAAPRDQETGAYQRAVVIEHIG